MRRRSAGAGRGSLGAIAGLFAAGAVLSLAFSVSVRLRSADFTERAADVVAARVRDRGTVAVCDVRRTVVQPAPRGAFAVHDFIYEWAAERALVYYTGRHATIQLAGELWNRPCPSPPAVDVVIGFDELLAGAADDRFGSRPIAREITVVVPTTGGAFLEGCLESIAAGTVWPACLVIVDQSGTEAAAPWAAALREAGPERAGISRRRRRHLRGDQSRPRACAHHFCGGHARRLPRTTRLARAAGGPPCSKSMTPS